jgi:hypothetical protein
VCVVCVYVCVWMSMHVCMCVCVCVVCVCVCVCMQECVHERHVCVCVKCVCVCKSVHERHVCVCVCMMSHVLYSVNETCVCVCMLSVIHYSWSCNLQTWMFWRISVYVATAQLVFIVLFISPHLLGLFFGHLNIQCCAS